MFASCLSLAVLAGVLAPAVAQTFTDCNPLKQACPPNLALGLANAFNFTDAPIDTETVWNVTNGQIDTTDSGLAFTVRAKKQAPTVKSNFYIFFGSLEIVMRAAKGKGIVSSIFLQSDDLDEIDWEWLGGNNTHVQTNYYGKNHTESKGRDAWHAVDDPQNKYHNYTITWSKEKIEWIIDSAVIRTLTYAESDGNGKYFPQTPMNIRVGNWDGGNSDSLGTRQWALQTDDTNTYSDMSGAPYTQAVTYIKVTDATNNATSYTYGDKTGSWQSIKVAKTGKSVVADKVTQPPPETPTQKFEKLPAGAKIGIFASVGGVVLVLLALAIFCCIKQRRAGRLEKAAEDAKWEKGNAELMAYRRQMTMGGFAQGGGGYARV